MLLLVEGAFAAPGGNYVDGTGSVQSRVQNFLTVVNGASSALTVGEGVCLDLTDDNGVSVDFCAASGNKPLCLIVDTSCAVGARCKCLKEGYFAAGAFAAGQGAAVAGGAAYVHTDGSLYGDDTDDGKHPIGVFLDAATVTGSVEIYVSP